MFYQSRIITINDLFARKMMGTINAAPATPLSPQPKAHLFAGPLNFTPKTPLSAFTGQECNFTGYVPISGSGFNPTVLNLGPTTIGFIFDATFVLASPGTVTQTANGYFMTSGAAVEDWMFAETFPSPVPFSQVGDFLDLAALMAFAEMVQTFVG